MKKSELVGKLFLEVFANTGVNLMTGKPWFNMNFINFHTDVFHFVYLIFYLGPVSETTTQLYEHLHQFPKAMAELSNGAALYRDISIAVSSPLNIITLLITITTSFD
jgi:hypothetical protein